MQCPSFRWPAADVLARLVRNVHDGEAGAIDRLLAVLRPSLVSFFGQRLSVDVAEDLAQLALIRISGAVERIDPERADAYISTVARNLLRTAYRVNARDRVRGATIDPIDLPGSGQAVDAKVEYQELVRAVHHACLTRMPHGLRDVALGLLHGNSTATIAHDLQISPITVRTRLMRVRAILREELGAYLETRADRRAS